MGLELAARSQDSNKTRHRHLSSARKAMSAVYEWTEPARHEWTQDGTAHEATHHKVRWGTRKIGNEATREVVLGKTTSAEEFAVWSKVADHPYET